MINFDRDNFDELSSEQKIYFVNDLVLKNVKLRPQEIEYLVPQNRDKYFYNRVRTSEWLDEYEFEQLNDREKEIYITSKRYLSHPDLKRLSPELQKKYISNSLLSGVQLSPEEFNTLHNDELRDFYAREKVKYSIDTTFTPEELEYLDEDDQIQYINTLVRMGLSPNPDEIPTFKPKAMRYFQSHRSLNEIRSIIRQEIRKIL